MAFATECIKVLHYIMLQNEIVLRSNNLHLKLSIATHFHFIVLGGQKGVKMNFWEKSENVMFLHSLRLSFMPKIRKIYRAVFRERGGRQTERQTERQTDRERRTRIQGSSGRRAGNKHFSHTGTYCRQEKVHTGSLPVIYFNNYQHSLLSK